MHAFARSAGSCGAWVVPRITYLCVVGHFGDLMGLERVIVDEKNGRTADMLRTGLSVRAENYRWNKKAQMVCAFSKWGAPPRITFLVT